VGVFFRFGVPVRFFDWVRFGLGIMLVMYFSVQTHKLSTQWSNPVSQAINWYEKNPLSNRAHGNLARTMFKLERYEDLSKFYEVTTPYFPNDVSKLLLWVELNCEDPSASLPDVDKMRQYARNAGYNHATSVVVSSILKATERGGCTSQGFRLLLIALTELVQNDNFQHFRSDFYVHMGRAYGLARNYEAALKAYDMVSDTKHELQVSLAKIQLYFGMSDSLRVVNGLESLMNKCQLKLRDECLLDRESIALILEQTNSFHDYDIVQFIHSE